MRPYRKRAYQSWNSGKRGKGTSDAAERQFSKREIKQQLDEDEEAYLERYHKGKRTRNMKARLEYRVKWYEAIVEGQGSWPKSMASYFQSRLREARKELRELIEKEKAS